MPFSITPVSFEWFPEGACTCPLSLRAGAIPAVLLPDFKVLRKGGSVLPRSRESLDPRMTSYRYASVTLTIIVLIPRTNPAWIVALHRFIEVSVGIIVALLVGRDMAGAICDCSEERGCIILFSEMRPARAASCGRSPSHVQRRAGPTQSEGRSHRPFPSRPRLQDVCVSMPNIHDIVRSSSQST